MPESERDINVIHIVEDDESIRQVIELMVEDPIGQRPNLVWSFPMYDILRIKEAIARDGQPDVLIMDLGLPGIDGIEALTDFKKYWPETKGILMTAYQLEPEQWNFLDSNGVRFIRKPFDLENFLAELTGAITEARQALNGFCEELSPEVHRSDRQ